jgi:hypothetical protein
MDKLPLSCSGLTRYALALMYCVYEKRSAILCQDPKKLLTLSRQYMAPSSAPSKLFNISTRDNCEEKKGNGSGGRARFSIRMRERQRRTRADHPLDDKIYLSIIRHGDRKLHQFAGRMVLSGLNGENWERMHYRLTNGPLPAYICKIGSSKVVHPSWLSTY